MNWKIKSLILGSSAAVTLCPCASMLASCNKTVTFDQLVSNMKETTISEFKWICKHYRRTFNNLWFCDMLQKRIKEIGLIPCVDTRTEKEGKYHPIQKKGEETCYGYNMYFDIPSNDTSATIKPIILQAHTDMVCVVAKNESGESIHYDWSKGVVPEISIGNDGKEYMHSKDYLTTLGADDGIGIATIFAIARHRNDFQHGKIRCLLTVDEEDGESGAKYIPNEWLDDFNYYLSLDGEDANMTWVSSAGASQVSWTYDAEATITPAQDVKQFAITISGFMGGHSGLAIWKKPMNPMIILGEILDKLQTTPSEYQKVRLVQSWDNHDRKEVPNGGTVPSELNCVIECVTNNKASEIKKLILDVLEAASHEQLQSGEDINNLKIEVSEPISPPIEGGLSVDETTRLLNVLCKYDTNKIYGAWDYSDEKHPSLGSNVAAVRIGDSVTKAEKSKLYIEFFGRANSLTDLNNFYENDHGKTTPPTTTYKIALAASFGENVGTWERIALNNPWVRKADDKMNKLIHAAADNYGMEMKDDPCFGWLEPAEIYDKRKDMNIGAIGPQVTDAHKVKETLALETVVGEMKIILYILQNNKV